MVNVLFPLLVAAILGLTLPGTSLGAEYLGPGLVKVSGVALLHLFNRPLLNLFTRRDYTKFIFLLFIFISYRTVNSSPLDYHWLLPWVSLVWLLIIVTGMIPENRVYWFSVFLLVPLFILIFSPGISRILDLSRGLAHDATRVSLKGFGLSYIIYAMSALAGFFIALTVFITSKGVFLRIFLGGMTAIAFIATVTAGSRGGMIAAISGVCFYTIVFLMVRKWRKLSLTASIYLVLLVIIILLPWENVFYAITSEDILTGSTAKRWYLWKVTFQMALERPLIGGGWEGIRVSYLNTTHSGWLQVVAELGLVGLVMEIYLWAMIFKYSLRTHHWASRTGDEETLLLNLGYMSLMVSYGVWQMVENISFAHGTRLIYLVAAALLTLYLRSTMTSMDRRSWQ